MDKLTKKQSLMAMKSLEKLIRIFGSQRAAAKNIGVTPPVLHYWRTGRKTVPCARCPTIERITGGAIRCEDLRPDIEWSVVRGTSQGGKQTVHNKGCEK